MNQVLRDPEEKRESLDVQETKSREGQEIEKKYKDKLEQFDRRFKWFEEDLEKQLGLVMKEHVPKLYDELRSEGVSIMDARAIIVGRLIRYRAERTIVHYLPDEAKDKSQQKKAYQSNAAQAKNKLEKDARENQELALSHGKTEEEAKEIYEKSLKNPKVAAGYKGQFIMQDNIDDPDEMRKRGSSGGTQRGKNIKERKETEQLGEQIKAEVVPEEEVDEEETEPTNENLITVKLVKPDANNDEDDDVKWANKLEYLWLKYGVAYLKVDQQGKIQRVLNVDMETQREYIERTEEPIETSD